MENFLRTSFLFKIEGLLPNHGNYRQIIFLFKYNGGLLFYKIYLRLSGHHFGLVFYFCFFSLPNKVLFIILNCSPVKISTVFIKARHATFEIASDLNITIFPSIVKSFFLYLSQMNIKVSFFFKLLIVRKMYSQNSNSFFN